MSNKFKAISIKDTVFDSQYSAVDFLHSYIDTIKEAGNWFRPTRFTDVQTRVVSSCMAWHPGLYRQMATCTSGIFLEFITDATCVYIELEQDEFPAGTMKILREVEGFNSYSEMDGVSVVVDEQHLGIQPIYTPDTKQVGSGIFLQLDANAPSSTYLPGLNPRRHVKVYLPCLTGAKIRNIYANSEVFEEVEARSQLLVLGDSFSQGFVCGDPSLNWCSLLGYGLCQDVINQGIGGQVFQLRSIEGLQKVINPTRIVVEFGANYFYEACGESLIKREIRTYFKDLVFKFPDATIWAITPVWFNEDELIVHPKSCFNKVANMIEESISEFSNVRLIDGQDILDHNTDLISDIYGHPNQEGQAQIAQRLQTKILSRSCASKKKKKTVKKKIEVEEPQMSLFADEDTQDTISSDLKDKLDDLIEDVDVDTIAVVDDVIDTVEDAQVSTDDLKDVVRHSLRTIIESDTSAEELNVSDTLVNIDTEDKSKDTDESLELEVTPTYDTDEPVEDVTEDVDVQLETLIAEEDIVAPLEVVEPVLDVADEVEQDDSVTDSEVVEAEEDVAEAPELVEPVEVVADGVDVEEVAIVDDAEVVGASSTVTTEIDVDASVTVDDAIQSIVKGGIDALPLQQVLSRKLGEISDFGLDWCLVDVYNSNQLLYAKDMAAAKRAAKKINLDKPVETNSDSTVFVLNRELGYTEGEPFYIGCYPKLSIKTDDTKEILVLDESYTDFVYSTYSHPEFFDKSEIERRLKEGWFIGGFTDDGDIVGFIGQHTEGSIGMLEVLPEYRHQGWAYALEAAMIQRHLDQGYVPWCQIFKSNYASLELQKKIGMMLSAPNHYYLENK